MTKKTVKKAVKKSVKKKATGPDKKSDLIIGYKTVTSDMTSWYDNSYKWTVGKVHTVTVPASAKDSAPYGVGLHFAPTKEGALSFADDCDNFIMLEVHAEKKHLLGKDNEKFRVSHLKVHKILENKTSFGKEWEAALKEAKALNGKFLQPNKAATTKAINAAVAAYAKGNGYTTLATHVVDNVFEANYAMETLRPGDEFDCYNDDDDRTDRECQVVLGKCADTAVIDHYVAEEVVNNIVLNYVSSCRDGQNKSATKPLFDLLKLGCLPLGVSNKHFAVFVPKENPLTVKSIY